MKVQLTQDGYALFLGGTHQFKWRELKAIQSKWSPFCIAPAELPLYDLDNDLRLLLNEVVRVFAARDPIFLDAMDGRQEIMAILLHTKHERMELIKDLLEMGIDISWFDESVRYQATIIKFFDDCGSDESETGASKRSHEEATDATTGKKRRTDDGPEANQSSIIDLTVDDCTDGNYGPGSSSDSIDSPVRSPPTLGTPNPSDSSKMSPITQEEMPVSNKSESQQVIIDSPPSRKPTPVSRGEMRSLRAAALRSISTQVEKSVTTPLPPRHSSGHLLNTNTSPSVIIPPTPPQPPTPLPPTGTLHPPYHPHPFPAGAQGTLSSHAWPSVHSIPLPSTTPATGGTVFVSTPTTAHVDVDMEDVLSRPLDIDEVDPITTEKSEKTVTTHTDNSVDSTAVDDITDDIPKCHVVFRFTPEESADLDVNDLEESSESPPTSSLKGFPPTVCSFDDSSIPKAASLRWKAYSLSQKQSGSFTSSSLQKSKGTTHSNSLSQKTTAERGEQSAGCGYGKSVAAVKKTPALVLAKESERLKEKLAQLKADIEKRELAKKKGLSQKGFRSTTVAGTPQPPSDSTPVDNTTVDMSRDKDTSSKSKHLDKGNDPTMKSRKLLEGANGGDSDNGLMGPNESCGDESSSISNEGGASQQGDRSNESDCDSHSASIGAPQTESQRGGRRDDASIVTAAIAIGSYRSREEEKRALLQREQELRVQLEVRRIKSEIADNEKLLSFQSKKLAQSRGLLEGLYQGESEQSRLLNTLRRELEQLILKAARVDVNRIEMMAEVASARLRLELSAKAADSYHGFVQRGQRK